MSVVARFEVDSTRLLAPDGTPVGAMPDFASDPETVVPLYRAMVRTRAFDHKAVAMQRAGELGTYASSLGEEAAAVGAASAMRPEDVLVPSFREHGAQLWRGVTPEELFLFWGGDERGADYAGPREDFPVSIPVASHTLHAAGVALAFKLRGEKRVAVCMFGDGATSKGDFYEAVNLAGVWRLPVVFVVANNFWAISVPRDRQTASETLAQKAIAVGMHGEQVDGNDAIAVREVVGRAVERARSGEGPTLVEATTYRLADHTTADDATRYRDPSEVSRAWQGEPIARLRAYLGNSGMWSKEDEQALIAQCNGEIDRAAEAYLAVRPQAPGSVFDYLHAALPDSLRGQRDALLRDAEDG